VRQVYYFMMAGDWLQGPYVYALYDSYGFSQEDIAVRRGSLCAVARPIS